MWQYINIEYNFPIEFIVCDEHKKEFAIVYKSSGGIISPSTIIADYGYGSHLSFDPVYWKEIPQEWYE